MPNPYIMYMTICMLQVYTNLYWYMYKGFQIQSPACNFLSLLFNASQHKFSEELLTLRLLFQAQGDCMQAAELYRKAFKLSPELENCY